MYLSVVFGEAIMKLNERSMTYLFAGYKLHLEQLF